MIFHYLNRPELTKKVGLSALLASGLVLCWTTSLNIAVLGVDVAARATFPLLATIGKMNLLNFLQRLDAIVVFPFLITMFFKTSLFFYGAVIGVVDLFRLQKHQQIVLPMAVIVIFLSLMIASNFAEHIEEGHDIVPYYIFIPLHIIIPSLMLLVSEIRKRLEKTKDGKGKSKSNTT